MAQARAIFVMKISVVIPLYNKELYIRRTLESVLRQSAPADEIVVVDDGSSDGSANEVLKVPDARIRLVQQPNAGESAARNRGIAEAKSELIAFLDADDEWKPDFLAHIQRLCNNFPDCGAYATAYEIIEADGCVHYPVLRGIPPTPWIGILPNWFKLVQVSAPFNSCSIAIPKKICEALGGFPTGARRGIDIMMWVRLSVRYPIAYSPAPLHVYHREAANRGSVTIPILEETACAKMMAAMLEAQEVPAGLLEDFKDYYARIQIDKARDMVKAGRPEPARALLWKVRANRRYRFRAWRWSLLSHVPVPLIATVLDYRHRQK